MAESVADANSAALAGRLAALGRSLRELYEDTGAYYRSFLSEHVTIQTPDKAFDEAFAWAQVSIEQLKVQTARSPRETALVAGFYPSGGIHAAGLWLVLRP